MIKKYLKLLLPALLLVTFVAPQFIATNTTQAVSASDWKAGRIIDDTIFFNRYSMSVQQIQDFLNAKVPVCDRNRQTYFTYAGKSYGPPFTCLKEYQENTTTKENNIAQFVNGAPYQVPGGKTAAQILYDAAQTHGINPQVLIVMLQKETGLVTDTWAAGWQYDRAMGYGCPDSGPGGSANCNTNYYGFYNQVNNAAWQLRRYTTNPDSYNFKAGVTRNILWNVSQTGCGSSPVFLENAATAALYNYTPYQPNAAALNNLYGTGNSCSAYGNRNFWRYFNDWFGSSTSMQSAVSLSVISQPPTTGVKGQDITYTYSLTNNFSYAISLDATGIVGRAGEVSSGVNRDFGWTGAVTLAAGETKQFTATTTLLDTGTLQVWPAAVYQGGYVQYTGARVAIVVRAPNISIESPLSSTPNAPFYAGQTVTFSASIKNNESTVIKVDSLGVPIRFYGKYSYDTGWTSGVTTINPGQTITVNGAVTLDKPGPYTAWLSWNLRGTYTTLSPALTLNVLPVSPAFILTYTETPNALPAIGEDVSVRFKLKNTLPVPIKLDAVGLVGRLDSPSSALNRDLGWVGPETFAGGEEKAYSFTRTISEINRHHLWVAVNFNGSYTQYSTWGFTLYPHVPNISVLVPTSVSPGLYVSRGQTITTTVQLKNNEPKPVRFSAIGIPIKYYGVYNYDSAWVGPGVLSASGQAGDTITINGAALLDKPGPYNFWASTLIGGKYQTLGSQGTIIVN